MPKPKLTYTATDPREISWFVWLSGQLIGTVWTNGAQWHASRYCTASNVCARGKTRAEVANALAEMDQRKAA